MKLTGCVALALVLLWAAPGNEAAHELRQTSVRAELEALGQIFKNALENFDAVYAVVAERCPGCDDECADSCLLKLLRQFEERLVRILSVIRKLQKLACIDCPGTFWTTIHRPATGVMTNPIAAPITAPLVSSPLIQSFSYRRIARAASQDSTRDSFLTRSQRLGGIFPYFESILIATNGYVYREYPPLVKQLEGEPRAITFDDHSTDVFVAEEVARGEVRIIRRASHTGDVKPQPSLPKYPADSQQPVDLTMGDDEQLLILLTDGTESSFQIIDAKNGVVQREAALLGVARRFTLDAENMMLYYTTQDRVYKYDIRDEGPSTQISDQLNASGIVFDKYGQKVYYCFSDSGQVTTYSTVDGSSTDETKNNDGCSDLNYDYASLSQNFDRSENEVKLFIASNTRSKVTVYKVGEADGTDRMVDQFNPTGTTSMTLSVKTWRPSVVQ